MEQKSIHDKPKNWAFNDGGSLEFRSRAVPHLTWERGNYLELYGIKSHIAEND